MRKYLELGEKTTTPTWLACKNRNIIFFQNILWTTLMMWWSQIIKKKFTSIEVRWQMAAIRMITSPKLNAIPISLRIKAIFVDPIEMWIRAIILNVRTINQNNSCREWSELTSSAAACRRLCSQQTLRICSLLQSLLTSFIMLTKSIGINKINDNVEYLVGNVESKSSNIVKLFFGKNYYTWNEYLIKMMESQRDWWYKDDELHDSSDQWQKWIEKHYSRENFIACFTNVRE